MANKLTRYSPIYTIEQRDNAEGKVLVALVMELYRLVLYVLHNIMLSTA
ncbi:hypothetical protein BofuT4_P126030.1 [Botrytis cinerea T4]|uniref:Uncharacterized protein n=1 Tax=Botryotinia fuckeliana (strain T4) TaxID=999810 RepID=G2YSF7_BOTF4|nr:hypothetical protein BofuT4_P126030.1 [Botrytis cinerea T4]